MDLFQVYSELEAVVDKLAKVNKHQSNHNQLLFMSY